MKDEAKRIRGGGDAGTKDDSVDPQSQCLSVSASPHFIHPSSLIPHPLCLPVAAVLLAAGRSRRMGAFKPLLPFGGGSVIESCVENLRGAGVAEIVVVLGHRADEVRRHLARADESRETPARAPLRFALNEEAGGEMGASIARGVEQLSGGARALLVALADHPAVSPEAIRAVVAAHARTRAPFVVPCHEGRGGHPVLVDLKLRRELSRLGEGGLRALMRAHEAEVLRLEVGCPFVARDVDTWEDYRALHSEVFGVSPPFARPPTD